MAPSPVGASRPDLAKDAAYRSMKVRLPVARHPTCRARRRLTLGVPPRVGKPLARNHFSVPIVEKPGLPRFEAGRNRMSRGMEMLRSMLTGRTIATADVPAFGATPQMKPPCACCEALDAALAARRHIRIDSMTFSFHGRLLRQQEYFAGATPRKRSMPLGGVPKRDSASDRDRQLSRPHGLNRILQVLRVLFGYESDRAHLRIFGGV
jgi:hypothetical protein